MKVTYLPGPEAASRRFTELSCSLAACIEASRVHLCARHDALTGEWKTVWEFRQSRERGNPGVTSLNPFAHIISVFPDTLAEIARE